jgi:hypothetical protein
MHQVGLAQSGAAMEEQGVEAYAPTLGERPGGVVGDLVGLADDEAVERVARLQRGAALVRARRRGVGGCLRFVLG